MFNKKFLLLPILSFISVITIFFTYTPKDSALAHCPGSPYGAYCYASTPSSCGYCLTGECTPYASGGYGPWCTPVCNNTTSSWCRVLCTPCGNYSAWCPPGGSYTTPIPTNPPSPPTTTFNGIVLDPSGYRWSTGSTNCAARVGVSISSSSGEVYWLSDEWGGHFDVYNVLADSPVTVTLTPPPAECNLECDTWSLDDGSGNGTGCVATFTTNPNWWGRNIHFRLKPKCIPTCSPLCGQSDGCTGTCTNTDCGDPSSPTSQSPSNGSSSPYSTGTPSVNLTWQDPIVPKGFSQFALRIHDTTTVWAGTSCSSSNPSSFCTTVPSTTHQYTFNNLVPNHLYKWWIHAVGNNCSTVSGQTCVGDDGWSDAVSGYFIYNACTPVCSFPACGQPNGCGGYCTTTDCGDPSPPTNQSPSNSFLYPYSTGSTSVSLTWQNPTSPKGFNQFVIQVHDTTTAWAGSSCSSSNPSSFCTTVPSTTHQYTFNNLIPNHLYRWWVNAKGNNCIGISGQDCVGDDGLSDSVGGYFIYNACSPVCNSPFCGQSNTCGGFCTSTDCGDPSVPTNHFPNNSLSSPYLAVGSTINMTWNDPIDPRGFDIFRLRVHDLSTAWKGDSFCSSTDFSSYCLNLSKTTHNRIFPPSGSLINGHTYHWWIQAYDWTNCSGVGTSCSNDDGFSNSVEGYFTPFINSPPSYSGIEIQNSNNDSVSPESGNRNQICHTDFNDNRTVYFIVTGIDENGQSDISNIELKWNNYEFPLTSINNGVGTFFIQNISSSLNDTGTHQLFAKITDSHNATRDWVPTGRYFKIWDCLVPVQGTVYDGTGGSSCLTSQGYTQPIPADNSYQLSYLLGGLSPRNMTVASPNYTSDTNNRLVWGTSYIYQFSNLNGSTPIETRIIDLAVGTTSCNTEVALNNNTVSPYSTNPSIRADFSSAIDQETWFQVAGGGINSINLIQDNIPTTCTDSCQSAITINNSSLGSNNNGLLISNQIYKGSSSIYGNPNNWYKQINRTKLGENFSYDFFYKEYFVKASIGHTISQSSTMSEINNTIGNNGIVFINGDLTIDEDNSIPTGNFLMLIVKGSIIFTQNADIVEGIFIADGHITSNGEKVNPLTINGILYSTKSHVRLTRNYNPQSLNNTNPATIVNYRPDFIFYMPGKLTKIFQIWKAN